MASNDRKHELLGMPHGTASSKLRKALLFDMASRLDLLACFRCGLQIERIDDFSIEHKEAWLQSADPKWAFFDLENIAYSHFVCNIGAGIKTNKIYANKKERKLAEYKRFYSDSKKRSEFLRKKRERSKVSPENRVRLQRPKSLKIPSSDPRTTRYGDNVPHGTFMMYRKHGCRCEECCGLISKENHRQYLKRSQAA